MEHADRYAIAADLVAQADKALTHALDLIERAERETLAMLDGIENEDDRAHVYGAGETAAEGETDMIGGEDPRVVMARLDAILVAMLDEPQGGEA